MRKGLLIPLVLSIWTLTADSQTVEDQRRDTLLKAMLIDKCYCEIKVNCNGGGIGYFYTGHQYITNYSMNRLIRKDLTKITTDEEGLPVLGNYASAKFSDDKSKVTFNTSFYNPFSGGDTMGLKPMKSILSFNVKAGINEGMAGLFSGQSVNNEAGIKVKYSILSKRTLYENDSLLECTRTDLQRKRLWNEYINIKNRYLVDSSMFMRKQRKYMDSALPLRLAARNLANARDSILRLPPQADLVEREKRDSVLQILSEKADSAQLKLLDFIREYDEFQSKKPIYKRKDVLDSIYNKLLLVETKNIKWNRFRLQWWDIDMSLEGNKYNLYTASMPADSQLSEKNFTRWAVGFSFNLFRSNSQSQLLRYGSFLKIGYSLSNDNTLTGQETKEVRTTVTTDSANYRREVISKVNAYDIPFGYLYSHTLTGQFSKYLNEKRINALSLYTSWVFPFESIGRFYALKKKPQISMGAGYLFAFLDKEKEKSIINIELFLNFNDLLNSAASDTKFLQRHQLGLKFGVPFNSLFINQK